MKVKCNECHELVRLADIEPHYFYEHGMTYDDAYAKWGDLKK